MSTIEEDTSQRNTTLEPYIKVYLDSENARPPKRQTEGAAAYDLYASEETVIPARSRNPVCTGVHTVFSPSNCLLIKPRSGFSFKHGIETGAGVIDSDYRGELKVLLHNNSDEDFLVEQGMRIAQFILIKIDTPDLEILNVMEYEDYTTARGTGGFGSTGV
jgi:dUTP pyrophosphatase